MRRLLLIAILMIVVPGIAWGASLNWGSCTSRSADTTTDPKLRPGASMCFDPVGTDLTSTMLDVGICENFDVIYNPDTGGTDVAISCDVMSCSSATTASTNNCEKIAGVTLSGTAPNTEIYGAAAQWIYVVCTGTIDDDTPRVLVHCAAGPGG